jgi:hypothetical protein
VQKATAGASFATGRPGKHVTRKVPRPRIVPKLIPFGAVRRAEMGKYALRHYGIDTWRLEHPHVIVQHYTATTTFSSVYNTFAADVPDVELDELPGVCSHFVIDKGGTIYAQRSTASRSVLGSFAYRRRAEPKATSSSRHRARLAVRAMPWFALVSSQASLVVDLYTARAKREEESAGRPS